MIAVHHWKAQMLSNHQEHNYVIVVDPLHDILNVSKMSRKMPLHDKSVTEKVPFFTGVLV